MAKLAGSSNRRLAGSDRSMVTQRSPAKANKSKGASAVAAARTIHIVMCITTYSGAAPDMRVYSTPAAISAALLPCLFGTIFGVRDGA